MISLPIDVGQRVIPKTLHQIWVGSKPPNWVVLNWTRWDDFMAEHHPDWEIHRWTDSDLTSGLLLPVSMIAERKGLPPRGLADLIRVVEVAYLGGVYMDSDTIPLRPLDEYVGERQGWIGTYPLSRGQRVLNNASFGFPPGHPFLTAVWEMAVDALARGVTNEHFVAGPRVFYKAWRAMPEAVDVDFHWEHVESGPYLQPMKRVQAYDLDVLRKEFPHAPVLHVLCNYGDWPGRTSDD